MRNISPILMPRIRKTHTTLLIKFPIFNTASRKNRICQIYETLKQNKNYILIHDGSCPMFERTFEGERDIQIVQRYIILIFGKNRGIINKYVKTFIAYHHEYEFNHGRTATKNSAYLQYKPFRY